MQCHRCAIALFLLPISFGSSGAQYPEAGEVYLSFSPDSRVQDMQVQALTPFEFYLVVEVDVGAGDPGMMSVIEGGLDFSSEIFLSDITWMQTTADVGNGLTPGRYDFQLAFAGPCADVSAGPTAVCSFKGLLLEDAQDLFVGVSATDESSVEGIGPAWLECPIVLGESEVLVFRDGGAARALSINPPVAVEPTTFTQIKGLYHVP